jgi:voltage-gated potassium channel Kch
MDEYFNCWWEVLMTITTVGYGDIMPFTTIGRLIIMVAAIWGAFLMSLMVVVLESIFNLPINE